MPKELLGSFLRMCKSVKNSKTAEENTKMRKKAKKKEKNYEIRENCKKRKKSRKTAKTLKCKNADKN